MIYFFSDVHLGLGTREEYRHREDILLDFLAMIRHDCERLYIVGDLFDYWFEYKTVVPKYFFRTITALYNLRRDGIAIEYLMGNHDFGHHTFFRDELDIPIHTDDITTTLHGKSFYIAHGDGKAYNDTGYFVPFYVIVLHKHSMVYSIPILALGWLPTLPKAAVLIPTVRNMALVTGFWILPKRKLPKGLTM